jgi:DNA-binding YbaB/EbfC family protein
MKDMAGMFKKAQEMQTRMAEIQATLEKIDVIGVSGGGMVALTLSGQNMLRKVEIDPALLRPEDVEILEDLIVAAHNDAKSRLETKVQEEMAKLKGVISLPPGLKLPF